MPRVDAYRVRLTEYCEMLVNTGRSQATQKKYFEVLRRLRTVARSMGITHSPGRWTIENVGMVLQSRTIKMDGTRMANASQLLEATVLRQFLSYCGNPVLDNALRTKQYRLPPRTRQYARWPTIDQIINLRISARANCPLGTYLMVVLAFEALLRRKEIANLEISDIRETHILVHGKGEKYREVYLTHRTRMEIWDYVENVRPMITKDEESPFLLIHRAPGYVKAFYPDAITERIAIAGRMATPPFRCSPHDLRRSGARTIYLADPSERTLSKIQDALGHSTIDQTRNYIGIGLIDQEGAFHARDRYLAKMYPEAFSQG